MVRYLAIACLVENVGQTRGAWSRNIGSGALECCLLVRDFLLESVCKADFYAVC